MREMAIIADDLTGASDSGVQFARKGLKTVVVFEHNNLVRDSEGIQTVVIDTDSRAIPPVEAYQRVKAASDSVKAAGFTHIYKKLDSTLRGNLGSEIDAVLDTFAFQFAVIAPAFPKIGRKTAAGIHYLNGVPIHQTEISRDPKAPVVEADVVALINSQSKRKAGLVPLQSLRAGETAVAEKVAQLLNEKVELIVFDAEQDDDLKILAETVTANQWNVLWVGSAGLADYLPATLNLQSNQEAFEKPRSTKQPVMLVAGSLSKVTREQIEVLKSHDSVYSIVMNPLEIVAGGAAEQAEMERCFKAIQQAFQQQGDIAFHADSSPDMVDAAKKAGNEYGMDSTAVSNKIADALGKIASRVIDRYPVGGMILTGGDTAKAVCRHLGVTSIELQFELEPGVPISRLVGPGGTLTVTKAGAFGTSNTLLHAMLALKGER